MQAYSLPVHSAFQYRLTGKFKAPSPEWRHMERVLEDFELIIMTEGTLYLALGGDTCTLTVGDFLLCPPKARQKGLQAADCSFYWLHFTVPGLENPPSPCTLAPRTSWNTGSSILLPCFGTLFSTDKLVVMMKQLQDAVRSYADSLYNNHLTTAILLEFANECRVSYGAQSEENPQRQLHNDVMDFIKWNIYTCVKVQDVAAHFGYNPKYLSHLFNALTGQSLKQYIILEKIKRAKFLLTDTNDSIQAIASLLGFQDSHNFMKLFKKHVGLTPMGYRNTYSTRLLYYV